MYVKNIECMTFFFSKRSPLLLKISHFFANTGATTSTDTNTRFNIGQGDARRLNVKPEILIPGLSHELATSFGTMSPTRLQSSL